MRSLTCLATCRRLVALTAATTLAAIVATSGLAQSAETPAKIMHRCDSPGLTPCDIILPDHDIALTLLPGYGLTAPVANRTPLGRSRFDIARIADGQVVVRVNAPRAQAGHCQDGLAGDRICMTEAMVDTDHVAVAFVLASLGSAAMAVEMGTTPEDRADLAPGMLQGVWFAQLDRPGAPDHAAPFIMMELFQDAGAPDLFGYFVSAADIGPLRGMTGDVTGWRQQDRLRLTLAATDGTPLLRFSGTARGDLDYAGDMVAVAGGSVSARLLRIAGPGEPWSGPAWMTGHGNGAAATTTPMPAPADDDPASDDRAMADLMDMLIGSITGASAGDAPVASAVSARLRHLRAIPVDLQGLPAEALIALILPFAPVGRAAP